MKCEVTDSRSGRDPYFCPKQTDNKMEAMTANKQLYRDFIDALNQQDFDRIRQDMVHADYHEECVGFTPGRVSYNDAEQSLRKVLVRVFPIYGPTLLR